MEVNNNAEMEQVKKGVEVGLGLFFFDNDAKVELQFAGIVPRSTGL